MHKEVKQNKGRSMTEMLGVLAIVGVLSIAGVLGYKMAINKHRANNILHDASLTLVDIGTLEPAPTAWKAVRFIPDSGLNFYGMRTTQGVDLVKVEGVPSAVCEVLLEYKDGADISEIYSDDAATTELTECADNQLMVFAYGSGNASETELACSKKKKLCKSPMFFDSETCECYMDTSSCDDADCSEGLICMDITEGIAMTGFYQGVNGICCPEDTKPVRKINSSDYICVLEDDVVHLVAPEGKGEADCPIGSNSLAWNGLDFVCCGEGTHVTVIPSRTDSLCCDEGVVSAVDRTGDFDDYACCPRGYIERGGTCIEPDDSCLIMDFASVCCSSTQTPYCSNYDTNGECVRAKCGGTECTPAKIDAIGVCCPSDGTPVCSSSNTDGTCSEARCCNGAITKFDDVAVCCPVDGTASCSEYNTDGTCRDASCCSDFDGIEVCCSSEETPYCYEYNTDGTCKNASCYWGTCTPYKYDSQYGGCCDGTVTKFDDIAACCSSEETAYCSEYNTDGTCKSASCNWGTCTPYKYDSQYGGCCSGSVTKLDDIAMCCSAGQTAYCYESDGTCKYASCGNKGCTPYKSDSQYGSCCDGTLTKFDDIAACCSSEETAYCSEYNTDGTCKYTGCQWGTCTPYKSDSQYGGCCSGTLTKFDDITACCSSEEPPYCSYYNDDGTCSGTDCCYSGTVTKFDKVAVCCSSDETPYCYEYDADGKCVKAECGGANCTIAKIGDAIACCTSSETIYCGAHDTEGTCNRAFCCRGTTYCRSYNTEGECQVTNCQLGICMQAKFDTVGICCEANQTAYCSSYNTDGTCKSASCCSGALGKFDDVAKCCSSNQTPYCSHYNANGVCDTASCASGTCTPYRKSAYYGACCKKTLSSKNSKGYQTCS